MSFITSPGVIVPPLTAGGVAYGTGSQAKMNSAGTTGQVLKSAGAGVPIWGASVTSIPVTVPEGGTSLTTLTANNVILGNGASAPTFVAPGTSGNLLTSNGTTWASTAATAAGLTLGTQITLSGTSALFTGIPANTKLIYLSIKNATYTAPNIDPSYLIKLGTSSGLQTGYYEMSGLITTGGGAFEIQVFSENQHILISSATLTNSTQVSGSIVFTLMNSSTNVFSFQGVIGGNNNKTIVIGGISTLPSALTQLSFQLASSTFSGGVVNISYM